MENRLSIKDTLRLKLFSLYRHSLVKEHSLDYLFWECTLRCNLNCRHCGSDCTKNTNMPDMPLADFVKVLDGIKEKNKNKNMTVCITGGEPLLRNDLEKAGFEIRKRGFNWTIVSNGLVMTKNRFDSLVRSGLGGMSLSIDGLEQEHNFLRKNDDSFKNVVAAIEFCVECHEKYPRLFLFDVITCVHSGNIDKLRSLREFLIEKGVKFWRLFPVFPSGRGADKSLSLSANQYRKLMDFIIETRSYKNKNGAAIWASHSCEGYLGAYELKVRDYYFFCRSGINIGSVMCDGYITGCLSVRSPSFVQGNIYKDDFMQVWNKHFENMRIRSWAKVGKCSSCNNWPWCEGNGLHLHKDDSSPPVYCNLEMLKKS